MIDEEKMMQYVQQYLAVHNAEMDAHPARPFRVRSQHIRRVCMWLDRLLVQDGVEDVDALRIAAIFHDVGYAHAQDDSHGVHSAEVLLAYARENAIDMRSAERAAFLVSQHSHKELLQAPDTPHDLILLMEADLLDEEGAMGLVFDCLAAGVLGEGDYLGVWKRMHKYEPDRLSRNPMVTPLAIRYWEDKQQILRTFMQAYAFDLGMDDEA